MLPDSRDTECVRLSTNRDDETVELDSKVLNRARVAFTNDRLARHFLCVSIDIRSDSFEEVHTPVDLIRMTRWSKKQM